MTRPAPDDLLIAIYRETIRPLYGYVSRRVGGDVGLAEDLTQETWMRAIGAWPSRGVPDEPLAWLIRVARNVLVSHFRRARLLVVDPAVIDLEAAPAPDSPDTAAVIGWGLAQLRRGHAEVLEAFYFDGKPVREIAKERSTSERAIEGQLRRARAKLRKALERQARGADRVRATREGTHERQTRTP